VIDRTSELDHPRRWLKPAATMKAIDAVANRIRCHGRYRGSFDPGYREALLSLASLCLRLTEHPVENIGHEAEELERQFAIPAARPGRPAAR
jgi:hypothetical protein